MFAKILRRPGARTERDPKEIFADMLSVSDEESTA